MTSVTDSDERYSRQRDIVPPERLGQCQATVIGVGAIGRQVALQLAAMGVPWLQLVDFDVVEESNLASQGFLEEDLGKSKVAATASLCQRINSNLELHPVEDRFRRNMDVGNVVFTCVDSIDIRRLVWESVNRKADCFIDGRMSAEVIRVLTASDEASRHHYPTTFFTAEQAYQGSCTARTTIYTSNIAAGLMICQFTKWLRDLPIESDISLNLLSSELNIQSLSA